MAPWQPMNPMFVREISGESPSRAMIPWSTPGDWAPVHVTVIKCVTSAGLTDALSIASCAERSPRSTAAAMNIFNRSLVELPWPPGDSSNRIHISSALRMVPRLVMPEPEYRVSS